MPKKMAASAPRAPREVPPVAGRQKNSSEHTGVNPSVIPGDDRPAERGDPPSLAARAYLEIRNQILKGELPIGVALSRRDLATGLAISVPPVTEALQRLENEGFLESRPRVGTRVRVPSRQDVEDRSLVREALETQAARLFAERAPPVEKEELRQRGREMDRLYGRCETTAVDAEFLFSVNTFHLEFHLRIAEGARCPALRNAIEKEQVLIFYWLYDTAVQRKSLASDYHAQLADAVAGGTPESADAAMRHHIRQGLQEVLAGLKHLGKSAGAWRLKKHERFTEG